MKLKFIAVAFIVLAFYGFRLVQTQKKIVFFGDSITKQGDLENGYVTLVDSMLKEKTGGRYKAIGAGVSGNKVYDLYLRVDDDVLAQKPDAVVIWIGVNDVWSKVKRGTGTKPDKFEEFYNEIIKELKQNNCTVFLCTPAVIGEKTDYSNEQDSDMNEYAALVKSIAKKNNCHLIDLRKEFLDYNLQNNKENKESGILTVDGVHLNANGNRVVADQMYRALSQSFVKAPGQ